MNAIDDIGQVVIVF